MAEKEIQEKIAEYQYLQQELSALNEYRENLMKSLQEYNVVRGALKEMEKSKKDEILFPIGGGFFAKGRLEDNQNLLVNLGSDVFSKKNFKESKIILDKKTKDVEAMLNDIDDRMQKYSQYMNNIIMKVNELKG